MDSRNYERLESDRIMYADVSTNCRKHKCFEWVTPDVIYNRFDLAYPEAEKYVMAVEDDNEVYNIPVQIEGNRAKLGIWLCALPSAVGETVMKEIFCTHPQIKFIMYQNAYTKHGSWQKGNHFRICLPETPKELRERLSSKGRYNIQREKRILERDFGKYTLEHYEATETPKEVFEAYFRMKKSTHGVDYHLSKEAYIEKYFVTDVYTLQLQGRVVAVLLSCEQCVIVYLENLTYDVQLSKYSLGQILYDLYLEELIKKGKRELYLAGGELSYKKRYGSIEETVYSGIIYRNKCLAAYDITLKWAKRTIKKMLRKFAPTRK